MTFTFLNTVTISVYHCNMLGLRTERLWEKKSCLSIGENKKCGIHFVILIPGVPPKENPVEAAAEVAAAGAPNPPNAGVDVAAAGAAAAGAAAVPPPKLKPPVAGAAEEFNTL